MISRSCSGFRIPIPRRQQVPDPGFEEWQCHARVPINVRPCHSEANSPILTPCRDLIFNVPQLISFLSQGTTLPAGTIILTGTPPGVGAAKNPKEFLKAGDEFAVELQPHVGTLITKVENQ